MDKHDLSDNDIEGKGDLCSTEPQNSVSIHKLLDENTFDNEDSSYLIEGNKKEAIDICYEDVSEDDFDYDNSADDELTDEKWGWPWRQKKKEEQDWRMMQLF